MRVLVGNHIDNSIRLRRDMAAWTQRVLWFAHEGDLVILPAQPDMEFLRYATALTGINSSTLRIHIPPPGRFGHRLLDPRSLTDNAFLRAVAADLTEVSEVFALWPSPQVSRFAQALGLSDRLPGADFFAQSGGELVNNKASFRALAAGARVPIAVGTVCRDVTEAVDAMARLLGGTGAVLVKQAHNGAGVGNQIVLSRTDMESGHVGARHLHQLDPGPDGIEAYWAQRWEWASADGRFPVVIEEFRPDAVSMYSEHHVLDGGVRPTETGILLYVGRRLSHQIVPLRHVDIGEDVRERLVEGGTRLAEVYGAIGYRGYLSADAILGADGQVLFTEVNAQVSGSLHIYDVIAHQIVGTSAHPNRSVVEYHVPPTWAVADFEDFLSAARELDCLYDPVTRTGVIVSMPVIPLAKNRAQFVFCVAYDTDETRESIYHRLDGRFARIPTSQIGSEHVGVGGHADTATNGTGRPEIERPAAVRLRPSFDAQRIRAELAEVTNHPWSKQRVYDAAGVGAETDLDWRVLPLRNVGGAPDRTDPGGPGADDFAPTPWLHRLPYVREIIDGIPAPLNAVRLMALGPGAASHEHSDPKYALRRGFVRLHIPIATNAGAVLVLDGVSYCWQPGEFWCGEFSRPHQVRNDGDQARIHLVIDALVTTSLVGLFPRRWQAGLLGGDVLFNRPSQPGAPPAEYSLALPTAFTDFEDDDAFDKSSATVTMRVTSGGNLARLIDAEGRSFALVHLGEQEFRFAGWSEQRTLQLLPDTAVLRVRQGRAVRTVTVPFAPARS